MIHRLKIGSIDGAIIADGDSETSIIRPAMLVYTGVFQSADGEVTVADDDIIRLTENHNKVLSKVKRLASNGSTDLPLKYCPPIQLDHSTSARDTVGRLIGEVETRETEIEGKTVKALFGNIKILGADNVERVKDGRWTNLSIGADFDDGVISEVTITPFPAAHESSFLSSKRNGENMDKAKLKKHLMDKKGLSEDEAEKELSRLSEDKNKDELSKLEKEVDEDEKKLTADKDADDKLTDDKDADDKDADDKDKNLSDDKDDDDKKDAKLTAARSKIKTLSAGFGESMGKARLAARQTSIMARLSRLRAAGKITPAEIKKMDISKLSAANQDAIDLVMETYESREPVIMAGMYGDARSIDISKVSEAQKKAKLEAETRRNMPFIAKVSGSKLSEGDKEADKDTVNVHIDTDPHTDLSAKDDELSEIEKLMDDGNIAEAKKRMKAWASKLKCLSDDNTEGNAKETEKQLSAMVENITKLEAQFNEMQQLASELAE